MKGSLFNLFKLFILISLLALALFTIPKSPDSSEGFQVRAKQVVNNNLDRAESNKITVDKNTVFPPPRGQSYI